MTAEIGRVRTFGYRLKEVGRLNLVRTINKKKVDLIFNRITISPEITAIMSRQGSNPARVINKKKAALNPVIHSRHFYLFGCIIAATLKDLISMPVGAAVEILGDRDMPVGIGVLIFSCMPVDRSAKIVRHKNMPVDRTAQICKLLPEDLGIDILARLGDDVVENILNRLTPTPT